MWKSAALLTLVTALVLLPTVGTAEKASPDEDTQDGQATTDSERSDGQPKEKKNLLQAFMRDKLAASNSILEGLVVDDLKMVKTGADALLQMSVAERWRASNDMLYRQHSREFRQSVKVLRSKADKGSHDGVALAWVDVTLNCIQCHNWVRNVLLAEHTTSPLLRTKND